MRKLTRPLASETPLRRPRLPWRPIAAFLLIVLAIPLVCEETAVCLANWRLMLGWPSLSVETPHLDAARELVLGSYRAAFRCMDSYCARLPWEPVLVMLCGMGIAVFMSIPLRRP